MKRNSRKMKQRRRRPSRRDSIQSISSVRSNKSEQLITVDFPLKTFKMSLSGSSTTSLSIEVDQPSDILDADAIAIVQKFAGWRILRATINMVPLSTTFGSSVFFFTDTENTTAPASFRSYRRKTYPNSFNTSAGYYMTWRPKDFQSLDFVDSNVAAGTTILNFYGYTNLTDLGTPSSTVDLWSINGTVRVQMRGLSV